MQYANQSLIKSLLPVIDNFERALAVDPAKADAASILKGMQIVHDQWLAVLKQQQVEEIAPQPGTPFDPTRHEALMQQDRSTRRRPWSNCSEGLHPPRPHPPPGAGGGEPTSSEIRVRVIAPSVNCDVSPAVVILATNNYH